MRETPEAPALEVLSEDEVEVLVCRFGKGMKPSELTIGQAVLWIGRLGGHLNRKRDGMPGVRTLWRGLHDLLPRQESFASLHILTRRASEGSEALPSLARRVSMSFFGARVITLLAAGFRAGKRLRE